MSEILPIIGPLFQRGIAARKDMYFAQLQRRLIETLRFLMGNGLLTERGLARSTGVSQPHMHHILKGTRALSPEIADRILRALSITVLDLLESAGQERREAVTAWPLLSRSAL